MVGGHYIGMRVKGWLALTFSLLMNILVGVIYEKGHKNYSTPIYAGSNEMYTNELNKLCDT